MSEHYTVTLDPLENVAQLESEWLDLENRSDCSFFLSWTWVGTWLQTFEPSCFVLRVNAPDRLVSLALITESKFSAPFRFSASRLHIHQKGNALCDQIWTEYNGFLCEPAIRSEAVSLAMKYLVDSFPGWDELVIGAITKEDAEVLEKSSGLVRRDLWEAPSFGVDLQRLRMHDEDYLSTLSKNTRHQIRRSIRLYGESGGLELIQASSAEEALGFLSDVGPLHLRRWGDGLSQSGFANPRFVSFHEALIRNGWPKGEIDFIKVKSGTRVLGYFYNFLYRNKVYFYLSGLLKESDSKLKPGLCGHVISIQHYIDHNYDYYDFMGGNERYKASLGVKHDDLFQVSLQKNQLKFKIEDSLRAVKRYISQKVT